MSDKLMKTLIGALVAIGLAVAVSYGLISQETADKVQNQTNDVLPEDKSTSPPAPQQPEQPAPAPQNPAARP